MQAVFGRPSSSRPFSGRTLKPTNENAGRWATGVVFVSGVPLLQRGHAATVAGPGAFVGADDFRPFLAVADGLNAVGGQALRNQVLADGRRAALAQCEVVLTRAALVAMAFDGDLVVRVLLQPSSLLVQGRPAVGSDRRHVGVEVNAVTDILPEVGNRAGRDRRTGWNSGLVVRAGGH